MGNRGPLDDTTLPVVVAFTRLLLLVLQNSVVTSALDDLGDAFAVDAIFLFPDEDFLLLSMYDDFMIIIVEKEERLTTINLRKD